MSSPAKHCDGYENLTNTQVEGTDFRVGVHPVRSSSIAVIAPHGGSIEQYTSDLALAVAGENFNLHLFEGIRRSGNYAAHHLTSQATRQAQHAS